MVVSSNQSVRKKADADVEKKQLGQDPKDEATESELERIRESLIEHRDNRDTTNIPSVERSSSEAKVLALRRRMQKARWGDQKNGGHRNASNATSKNSGIADSGSADSVGGGDSGGGGDGGGGQ